MPLHLFRLTVAAVSHRFEHRLAEWSFTLAMAGAGAILLRSGQTFELAPYGIAREIAAEETWGAVMLAVGLARLAVLVANGWMPRGSPHLRFALAAISALIWSVLLAGFLAFPTWLLITAFIGVAILTELINAFRAARDARCEDDEAGERQHGLPG